MHKKKKELRINYIKELFWKVSQLFNSRKLINVSCVWMTVWLAFFHVLSLTTSSWILAKRRPLLLRRLVLTLILCHLLSRLGETLDFVSVMFNLGFRLNCRLSALDHVNFTKLRLSSSYVPIVRKRRLIKCLVVPFISYGANICGS